MTMRRTSFLAALARGDRHRGVRRRGDEARRRPARPHSRGVRQPDRAAVRGQRDGEPREPGGGEEGRQAHRALGRRRRLARSRQDVLHVHDRASSTRCTAGSTPTCPRTRASRCRTSPSRRAGDRRRRQDGHREAAKGRDVLRPGRPRGHVGGHQVRDRARVHRGGRPTATSRPTSATSSARRTSPATTGRCRASGRPTSRRSCSSSRQGTGAALAGALAMPISIPVPKEFARRYDRRCRRPTASSTPSTPVRTRSRATRRAT